MVDEAHPRFRDDPAVGHFVFYRVDEAHPVLARLAHAVDPEPDAGRSWATGAVGEQTLGRALDALSTAGVLVLHDRRLPGSKANIDHIAVTANGVWVIDAKRYRGLVDDPDKGAMAKRKLDAIVLAATQMLMAMKTPKPGKVPLPITLSAFGVCAVLLGWLAWAMWGH